jgi:outer membrane biosynthesis protein TonB
MTKLRTIVKQFLCDFAGLLRSLPSLTGSAVFVRALRATLLVVCSLLSFSALAADLYVSASGNDSSSGTQLAPLKTIARADVLAKPGDTIHVASGTYNVSASALSSSGINTAKSGTASARIKFVSDVKGGAKIVFSGTGMAWRSKGSYVEISGFDITGTGRIGILVEGANSVLTHNFVHDLTVSGGCNGSGGSGLNIYGAGTVVDSNVVRNVGAQWVASRSCNTVQGIYATVPNAKISNNIISGISSVGINNWHGATGATIVNNTIFYCKMGIWIGQGDAGATTTGSANNYVANNIIYDTGWGITESGTIGPNNRYVNNLLFNAGVAWRLVKGTASGTVTTNPMFVNYQANGTGNYRLQSASPAINKGTSSGAPLYDIDGMARPQGGAYDIGAYENGGSVSPTPTPTPSPTPKPSPTPTPTPTQSPSPSGVPVTLSATALTFGPQAVGTTSAIQYVTLKNTGTVSFKISTAFVITGDFAFGGKGTCTLTSYAPGTSCTASVVFKPTATGTRTGTLSMLTSASSAAMVVKLTGNYVAPTPTPTPLSTVTLSPYSLSFTSNAVGTKSATQYVTLKNGSSVTIDTSKVVTLTGDFATAGSGTCSSSLAAGASCLISVAFTPTATGTRTGTLTVITSASSTAMVVNLSGNVTTATPTPTPTPLPSPSPTPIGFPTPTPKPSPTPTPTPKPSPTPAPSPVPSSLYNLYVSPSGSDSNSGTQSAPFKTIAKASTMAKPGTTVHVAPGTYAGGFQTGANGTASARIVYVSDTKWGAKVVGSGSGKIWHNYGNYVTVDGFDLTGASKTHGLISGPKSTTSADSGYYFTATNNYIHDMAVGICGSAGAITGFSKVGHSTITNNVIKNIAVSLIGKCATQQGIYISDANSYIANNVISGVAAIGIHQWHAATASTIVNNTVFHCKEGILIGDGDSGALPGGSENNYVANNIVYDHQAYGIVEYGKVGKNNRYVNNLVFSSGTNVKMLSGTASGTISANPMFVNYQANGSGNYRLQSSSPAIDKGLSTSAPLTDIEGVRRPKGAGIDIGAYESY